MQLIYDSGYFAYAIVKNGSGQTYNKTLAAFEAWNVDNLTGNNYDYDVDDQGGDQYLWTFPVLAEADYTVIYYLRASEGASPTIHDLRINDRNVYYTGSAILDPAEAGESMYISIETGDNLALNRLNTIAWDDASDSNKTIGIKMATEAIDTLNFIGDKADDDQDLEFPRDDDAEIPVAIQRATFEIALALLDGADPELEYENLNLVSQGIANVRSTYSRSSSLPHIIAGITSPTAWRLLLPYLRDGQNIKLSRVD